MTSTPYSYQKIMLMSDYSVVEGFYSKKPRDNTLDGKTLKNYVHPFMFTYTINKTCSRYICANCAKTIQEKGLSKEKKEFSTKKETLVQECEDNRSVPELSGGEMSNCCEFCLNICDCDRCSMV